MTASRFFIIEPAFCERDKNHKFDNFKTILFKVFGPFLQENTYIIASFL